jgi:hypothetical protein
MGWRWQQRCYNGSVELITGVTKRSYVALAAEVMAGVVVGTTVTTLYRTVGMQVEMVMTLIG